MRIRIYYLLIIPLIVSSYTFGQVKYFKTPNGKIINYSAYSKLKTDKLNDFKASFSEVSLEDKFKELYRNRDSIVYTYTWSFKMEKKGKKSAKVESKEKYIGKIFPIKTLTTINGKSITLTNLKGKPTMINFWFTKCKPCVDEIATLNKIQNTFKGSVNFIAITYEKKDIVTKFLRTHNYDFIQVINAQNLLNEFEISHCPQNIFLDKNGKVVCVKSGIPYTANKDGKIKMGDGQEFIEILKKLL